MTGALAIEVHGARGSTAVSGRPFLRYGGNTTCFSITLPDGHHVIIDAGTGLGRLQRQVADSGSLAIDATILLTHVHWDHIQGLPSFAPLYEPGSRIRIIASAPDGRTAREALESVIRPPWFPVPLSDAPATVTFEALGESAVQLGPLEVLAAPLRHPGGVVAYRLRLGDRAVVVATDVEAGEASSDAALDTLARGAAVLIHDAQYTPAEYARGKQGWGHSTWEHATRAAARAGVGELLLTSHDPGRTDDEVDAIVTRARHAFPATGAMFEGLRIPL